MAELDIFIILHDSGLENPGLIKFPVVSSFPHLKFLSFMSIPCFQILFIAINCILEPTRDDLL